MRSVSILLPLLFAAPLVPTAAQAAARQFSGSFQNVTPPGGPGGRCGPPPTLTLSFAPEATTGVSNFGAFTVTASHCVRPTPPVSNYGDGRFLWTFASGDTLLGTYTGVFTLVPGAPATTVQDYVVTGGTGLFDRATGTFQHRGTAVFGAGGVTMGEASFEGSINTVPEPAAWAMLIIGFGAIGASLRRQRGGRAPC